MEPSLLLLLNGEAFPNDMVCQLSCSSISPIPNMVFLLGSLLMKCSQCTAALLGSARQTFTSLCPPVGRNTIAKCFQFTLFCNQPPDVFTRPSMQDSFNLLWISFSTKSSALTWPSENVGAGRQGESVTISESIGGAVCTPPCQCHFHTILEGIVFYPFPWCAALVFFVGLLLCLLLVLCSTTLLKLKETFAGTTAEPQDAFSPRQGGSLQSCLSLSSHNQFMFSPALYRQISSTTP